MANHVLDLGVPCATCGQRADHINGDGATCGECLDAQLQADAEQAAAEKQPAKCKDCEEFDAEPGLEGLCGGCEESRLDYEADEFHRENNGEPAGGWLGYEEDC
jgi:hypothetical protein